MKIKKILAVLLSVILIVSFLSVGAFAAERDQKLKFNANGKFRILQIADIQDGPNLSNLSEAFIRYAVGKLNPDLIVLTGDNIFGKSCKNAAGSEKAIRAVMDVFEDLGVPVAIVFGNHDDQGNNFSKEQQMAIYQQYSVNRSVDQADTVKAGVDLEGCGTYNLPIYSSRDNNKVAFNVWMFDSGSYDSTGGYDHVHEKQLEWYGQQSDALKAANGGAPVYSLAFQHIVVPEIYEGLKKVSILNVFDSNTCVYKSKRYKLPSDAKDVVNYLGETPCCSEVNGGELDAFIKHGDVLAVVSGHDHTNAYTVRVKGINIVNSGTCGFGSYGLAKSRGVRYFDINENNTSTYTDGYLFFSDWVNTQSSSVKASYRTKNSRMEFQFFFVNLWTQIQNTFGISNLVA